MTHSGPSFSEPIWHRGCLSPCHKSYRRKSVFSPPLYSVFRRYGSSLSDYTLPRSLALYSTIPSTQFRLTFTPDSKLSAITDWLAWATLNIKRPLMDNIPLNVIYHEILSTDRQTYIFHHMSGKVISLGSTRKFASYMVEHANNRKQTLFVADPNLVKQTLRCSCMVSR